MTTRKAWVAAIISALIAFLTSLSTAFQGENSGFGTITTGQWITAVVACLVAFAGTGGLTYAIPNAPSGNNPPPEDNAPSANNAPSADEAPARP